MTELYEIAFDPGTMVVISPEQWDPMPRFMTDEYEETPPDTLLELDLDYLDVLFIVMWCVNIRMDGYLF